MKKRSRKSLLALLEWYDTELNRMYERVNVVRAEQEQARIAADNYARFVDRWDPAIKEYYDSAKSPLAGTAPGQRGSNR